MVIKGSDSNNLKEYIHYFSGSYAVRNDKNGVLITFGRFKSEDIACAAAALLIKHDWNINDVKQDSLIKYDGEFWVFKVMNNKLIFDSKFDTYERAVEYHEINSRCNDFHNDIFKDAPKRNRYKERFAGTEKKEEPVADAKYIFENSGKYSLKRSNRKGNHVYGEFESFEVARAARKLALDKKWRLKDGTEIVFYNGNYWVFEASDNVMDYKGKSESYDEAFEIIQPSSKVEYNTNPYMDNVSKNLEMFSKKNKRKSNSRKRVNKKPVANTVVKRKVQPVEMDRIWTPLNKYDLVKYRYYKFNIVTSSQKMDKLVAVLEFNLTKGNIRCKVDNVEFSWKDRLDFNLKKFPELNLILDILERNQWDLNKINSKSCIHYYNDNFYKVQSLNQDMIIFNKFDTYKSAENNPIFYKRRSLNDIKPQDIDKSRGKFELIKFNKGQVLKIAPLKSLEEIKAVRDILINIDWDIKSFKEYDLYYLNGIYWNLIYSDHVIYLIDKYGSVNFI